MLGYWTHILRLDEWFGMEEKQNSAKDDLQIRVLHLTDRIPGYGTTRLLWDIVRLTPPQEVKHLVVYV